MASAATAAAAAGSGEPRSPPPRRRHVGPGAQSCQAPNSGAPHDRAPFFAESRAGRPSALGRDFWGSGTFFAESRAGRLSALRRDFWGNGTPVSGTAAVGVLDATSLYYYYNYYYY